jgi:alpha-L-fucosidase
MNVPKHVDPSVNEMIRKLQPSAVINNRGFDDGDFGTPEREYQADDAVTFDRPTEACNSVGVESWGYRKDEDYYTDRHLMRGIDRYLARGANYLLNVGPMASGEFPQQAVAILTRVGKWYQSVKESLEGAEPASQLTSNRSVSLTRRANTLYVHLNKDPASDVVKLKPIAAAPKRATLLNTGRPVDVEVALVPSEHANHLLCLRLRNLPVNDNANTVLVAKLEFDRAIESTTQPSASPDKVDVMQM